VEQGHFASDEMLFRTQWDHRLFLLMGK